MKLGIVGSGMIVHDLLSFVSNIPAIKVEGIYARSKEKVQTLQDNHSIRTIYATYEEMLNDHQIDTVYIGLPNHLHYEYAKKAMLKGKHVICEKPFTSNLKEFNELKEVSHQQQVMLLEAISNQYQEQYHAIKRSLPHLGDIKVIECNYSQYSSRYKDFKQGIIHPVFDASMAGGAIMDINIYCIHFVVGLYGLPDQVQYFPNVENGIDTSGVLIMDYGSFKSVCIGAKDSSASPSINIQGNKGSIHIQHPANHVESFTLNEYGGATTFVRSEHPTHRMYDEFVSFAAMIQNKDFAQATKRLEHSERVMQVLNMVN
ncbi:Gfo/Idh/MocA family protein [Alkalicoccobacillus gibsonii]|uniref:Gfo/Idh/MocA family protein n=1 Tax=Alkalicoccobacillus gibsonii TaxID=79881 RepID=UPI0035142700